MATSSVLLSDTVPTVLSVVTSTTLVSSLTSDLSESKTLESSTVPHPQSFAKTTFVSELTVTVTLVSTALVSTLVKDTSLDKLS